MSRRFLFIIIYFSFFVAGCSTGKAKNSTASTSAENKNQTTIENTDSVQQKPGIKKDSLFERLVTRMDSLGYHPDTTYFDEKMYQDGVFHYVNYESHIIHEMLIDTNYNKNNTVENDFEIDSVLSRVSDIRIYPWRMPNTAEGRMRAGQVEEWFFETSGDAKYALSFFENEQKSIGFPFIKTQSYYFQCGSSLYLFHSNDSGVGYRHKQFYEWIEKKCSAD